jgi:hypothetical protein
MHIDFSRVDLIRNSSIEDLENFEYLEKLILDVGVNNEEPQEQPDIVLNNTGGLRMWQYPNQFAKYILFAKKMNIKSYLEIGCRWGGTFAFTTEYLAKTCGLNKSVSIDIIDSPVKEYCKTIEFCEFFRMDSRSFEFKKYINNKHFDMIFIDGFHSFEAVSNDYEVCKNSSNMFVFHDISNDACPGVEKFWLHLKESDDFEFYEFTDQYEEVLNNTNKRFLGIGIAVRKTKVL